MTSVHLSLSVVGAAVHLALCIGCRRHAGRFARNKRFGLNPHLTNFSYIWLLLFISTAFFAISAMMGEGIKEGTAARIVDPHWESAWHMVVMLTSTITNLLLLQAIANLAPVELEHLHKRFGDKLLAFLVLASSLTVLPFLQGAAKGTRPSDLEIGFFYMLQGVTSAGLLALLGFEYRRIYPEGWRHIPFFVYAGLLVSYWLFLLGDDTKKIPADLAVFESFLSVLLLAKAGVGIALLTTTRGRLSKHGRRFDHAWALDDALGAERQRKFARRTAQVVAEVAVLALMIYGSYHLYRWTAVLIDPELVVLRVMVVLIPAWLAFQCVWYWVHYSLGYQVDWEYLRQHMDDAITIGRSPGGNNRSVMLKRHDDEVEGGRHVVLLHGLGGSPERSWGLLPFSILLSRKVRAVHLLSYGRAIPRWSSLDREWRDTKIQLEAIGAHVDSEGGDVLVFGHSLGGLLAMRAMADVGREVDRGRRAVAARTLVHLTCINSPLFGTFYAFGLLPWRWGWQLLPFGSFVRDCLRDFDEVFSCLPLRKNQRYAPSCSLLCATRDRLIGHLFRFIRGPEVVDIPEKHSTVNELFSYAGDLTLNAILRELDQGPAVVRSRFLGQCLAQGPDDKVFVFTVDRVAPLQGRIVAGDHSDEGVSETLDRKLADAWGHGEGGTPWNESLARDRAERSLRLLHHTERGFGRVDFSNGRECLFFVWADCATAVVLSSGGLEALRGRA